MASERLASITCGVALVAGRLGVLHVGDRDEAHFEALVGLVELAVERLQGDLLGFQVVLRGEHGEIGLRDADQVLLGRAVIRLGLRDLAVGRLQVEQFAQENRFCCRVAPYFLLAVLLSISSCVGGTTPSAVATMLARSQ